MDVVASQIVHYSRLALAVDGIGRLGHFYSGFLLSGLPERFTRAAWPLTAMLEKRTAADVRGLERTNLLLHEAAAKGMARTSYGRSGRSLALSNAIFDLGVAARLRSPQVFHFTSGTGLYSAAVARARGAFVVCHRRALHHAIEAEKSGSFHPESALTGRLSAEYAISDLVVCNSMLAAMSFKEAGYAGPTAVVHNTVDTGRFRPGGQTPRPVGAPLRVLFVGALDVRKGGAVLIEALRVAHDWATARFVGTLASQYADTVRDLPNVTFVGPVGGNRLVGEYQAADVLVLPSMADSFGLVALEAAACGTAVLVTDQCGVSEVLLNSRGLLKAGEADDLVAKLRRLAGDRQFLQEQGEAALAAARAHGHDRYNADIAQLYADVILPSIAGKESR